VDTSTKARRIKDIVRLRKEFKTKLRSAKKKGEKKVENVGAGEKESRDRGAISSIGVT